MFKNGSYTLKVAKKLSNWIHAVQKEGNNSLVLECNQLYMNSDFILPRGGPMMATFLNQLNF